MERIKNLRVLLPAIALLAICAAFSPSASVSAWAGSDAASPQAKVPEERKGNLVTTQSMAEFQERLIMTDKPKSADIDPGLFKDFWRKWELVTTRYKPDGNELRFIYANKAGAEALAQGTYPFPEGAVFAKIGAVGEHDPIFDNSLVPGSINRLQVMLKSKDDPRARDGWVYSLYTKDGGGHLTDKEIDACQACHLIAADRDMIFAQPFPSPFGASPARDTKEVAFSQGFDDFRKKFQPVPLTSFPAKTIRAIKAIDPRFDTVMYNPLPIFSGSLFESREILAIFARDDQRIYAIGDAPPAMGGKKDAKAKRQWLLAVPDVNGKPGRCVRMIEDNLIPAEDVGGKTGAEADFADEWSICYGAGNVPSAPIYGKPNIIH